LELAPWFLLAGVWVLVTHAVQPIHSEMAVEWWARPIIALDALCVSFIQLLFPVQLGMDYGRTPASVLHNPVTILACLLSCLLILLLWRMRARLPWTVGGGIVFCAGLLPTLGLIPFAFQIYSTVADRYLYLALLGLAILLAEILARRKEKRL